ncbi:MAG: hypothetical protein IJ220_06810 [Clostridia bacterium]|nr:hypothetical protein [Clostridia bacterium]
MVILAILIIVALVYSLNSQQKKNEELEREVYNLKKTIAELKKNNNINLNQQTQITSNNINVAASTQAVQNQVSQVQTINKNVEDIHEQNSATTVKRYSFEEYEKVKNTVSLQEEQTKNILRENEIRRKESAKNNLILVSGALLIVLAAIVFLLSTWNTTPGIVKVGVLGILIVVFLGSSSLAGKKYKLEQTSKAFFYIAMAYIPLVLIAIAFFKLFGEYLSLYGEGKFIYLSVCSLFLTLLYAYESNKKNNNGLLFASMFCEAFTSFFGVQIFTSEIKVDVSIASIILAILYFIQSYQFKNDIIAISSMAFQILGVLFSMLIFIKDINTIIFGMMIYSIVLNLIIKSFELKRFSKIYHEFNQGVFFVLTCAVIISNIYGWIFNSCTVMNVINLILLLVSFNLQGFQLKEFGYILNLTILSLILSIISLKNFTILFEMKLLIMSVAVTILYAINYFAFKNLNHKIITYIAFNFVLLSVLEMMKLREYFKYVPLVSTIVEMFIELMNVREDDTKYYIVTSFVISFVMLNIEVTLASFISLLIAIIAFLFYTKNKNLNELVCVFPMLAIMPSVYLSDLFANNHLGMIVSTTLIIYTTLKSIVKKEFCIETVFSVIYIVSSIFAFKLNAYVSSIFVMLWALAHMLTYENGGFFKVIVYIAGLVIYNNAIVDLHVNQLAFTKLIGYLVCLYLITRTVVKTAGDIYKPFEYIGTTIIYIVALYMYQDMTDVMIFIGMLLLLTIISYYKKVGPLFVVSLFAIVVNFFKLTKDFWFSIPWWVYLVTVGGILMAFAISNEASQNNGVKNKLKSVAEKIKEDIDA